MKEHEDEHIASTGLSRGLNRRAFCVNCIGCVAGLMMLANPRFLSESLASIPTSDEIKPKLKKKDIRRLFMQKGSCAHLFLYIVNHEYGYNRSYEERAIDHLAGGLAKKGHQCGMLWGASMGASAETYRRSKNKEQAMAIAVDASKQFVGAFTEIAGSPDCFDITHINLSKRLSNIKMVFSSAGNCFHLAYKWYQKSIETTENCLSQLKINDMNFNVQRADDMNSTVQRADDMNSTVQRADDTNFTTCASEVARRLGGSDEEMVMVSGFAGGLGLSGNACGALSAAIWMKTLDYCRKNPDERGFSYGGVEDILASFDEITDGQILCNKIAGRQFDTIEDHTAFVNSGGCKRIIEILAGISIDG